MAPAQLAKLTTPHLGKVYLRTRLFQALDAARDKPVTWISAPGGSGKTLLVASYLKQNKIKPWWYQVDEGDAELASFFYYLGRLDKQVNPRRKKPLPLLTPEYLASLPIFTRNFFRELYSRIKPPGILVFDNFQDAGTDIALHKILPQAFAEIPKGINVMVISRAAPPASVARLQATHEVALLDWNAMRLTDEESVAVGRLHDRDKLRPDTTYLTTNARVDGWIAGLVLSLKHGGENNPLWCCDAVMSRLLAIALAHDIETDYARLLIRQRHLIPPDDIPVPDTWPFPIKVYTFGRFSLVINDEPVVFDGKAPKKALEVLKALIAFGGRDVGVQQLTDALWPDAEADAAYQAFTMALQRLRNILDHKDALVLREGKLTLVAHYVWVDVWVFERGLGEADPKKVDKTLCLYKGGFLVNEIDAPWALSAREHLQQHFLRVLADHGKRLEQQGEVDEAVSVFERGLEVDPLAESFYQGLMRCHKSLGRPCEAVKAYERCKEVLKDRLGVGPSDQTQAIYHAIQTND